jgi:hypothetical protein
VVLVVVISVIVWIDDPDSGTVAKSDVELPDKQMCRLQLLKMF